jgi:hypothetical protein
MLLDRPVYSMAQVDRVLDLKSGTAERWIDGYTRGAKRYAPVVRTESTGTDIVSWGEFSETRLLAEFRGKGARILTMRPAVQRLRDELDVLYPPRLPGSTFTAGSSSARSRRT